MKYVNARSILPKEVLKLLQEYAEGELLYIPKRRQSYKLWGEVSGGRDERKKRNEEIRTAFQNGASLCELADKYCLSEDTIKKIVYGKSQKGNACL